MSRYRLDEALEYGAKDPRSVYNHREKISSMFDKQSYSGPRITFSQGGLCQNCTKLFNIPYLYEKLKIKKFDITASILLSPSRYNRRENYTAQRTS